MLRNIRWRIAIPYVLLILLSTLGLTAFLSARVRQARLADLEALLLAEARALKDNVRPVLDLGESPELLDPMARRWAALLETRVTIIAPDGTVLGESHADRTKMDNHRRRLEVQQALTTGQGRSTRFSQTMGYEMMYAALPVVSDGEVIGIVRVALPLAEIEASVSRLGQIILAAGVLTALLAVPIALLIADRIARPLRRLTRAADRMAEGDLSARLLPSSQDEIGHLTVAFNHMADELHEKMTTLAREQTRLSGVLKHMADGILITDASGRVQLINPAAARLLGTSQVEALGHSFTQVVRDHHLIEIWEDCCGQGERQSETLESVRLGRFLRMIVTPLQEIHSQDRLVILQDLTEIRRLDTVRRDFISNISHELRTPLASLKALVDTLRDGALDDPPAAQRFFDRIETEVDAMTQMVQELLELSRIESRQVPLRLAPTPVVDVVARPTERLHAQAERAQLSLDVDLSPELPQVLADAERVQQVVTNLVHNAIKFTRPGGQVTVRAYTMPGGDPPPISEGLGSEVVIEVTDTGVGIPADDLPRIFERFFKADRARTGGGTGLGLAISKHIVQSHGGRIWADSIEGQGSTFYFSLLAVT
jgi:two-component system phosphate regulon sensor histidine kinase PhoR